MLKNKLVIFLAFAAIIFVPQRIDLSYLEFFTSSGIIKQIKIDPSKNNSETKSIKIFNKSNINEEEVYENFNAAMYENEYLNAFHVPYDAKDISKCRKCIDLLKKYIVEINIDDDQFRQMVNWIALSGDSDLSVLIIDGFAKNKNQDRLNIIKESILNIENKSTIADILKYYDKYQEKNMSLEDSLIKMAKKSNVSYVDGNYYFLVATASADQIMEKTRVMVGDVEKINSIISIISESGYIDSAEVFIKLYQEYKNTPLEYRIIEMSKKWSAAQFSGSRMDFLEENMPKEPDARFIIATMLRSSEDQERASKIMAKNFNDL